MEITGTVLEIGQTTQVTDKFKKRDLILEYADNPQYPEQIKFEAHQAVCDKLDELRPGDTIKVHFNLRGRKWTDKQGKDQYFNTLALWKFEVNQTVATPPPPAPVPSSAPEDDDLPFS